MSSTPHVWDNVPNIFVKGLSYAQETKAIDDWRLNKDKKSFQFLLIAYTPRLQEIARRRCGKGLSQAECFSAASLGLIRALHRVAENDFKSSGNLKSFHAYFQICIDSEILEEKRRYICQTYQYSRRKNKLMFKGVDIDTLEVTNELTAHSPQTPEDQLLDNERRNSLQMLFSKSALNPINYNTIVGLLDGRTHLDMATENGITESASVYRAKAAVKILSETATALGLK